jgi:hypothetical protein
MESLKEKVNRRKVRREVRSLLNQSSQTRMEKLTLEQEQAHSEGIE